jgi:hypothetical protein
MEYINNLVKNNKIEIEREYNQRRLRNIKEKIFSKRGIENNNKKSNNLMDFDNLSHNTKIDKNLIIESLNFLFSNNNNKNKPLITNHLKLLRKEFCKNISEDIIKEIIKKIPDLIGGFKEYLFDFKNSEIQFESIWILNNLSVYFFNINEINNFYNISNMLINLLKNENQFSNSGVRNLIFEKIFKFMGNLIFINNDILNFYLENNILDYLFECLNSPVKSLRIVSLAILNKILIKINNNAQYKKYTSIYFSKNSLYNYKFILSRIDGQYNKFNIFDEIYEIYWLINELIKIDFSIVNFLFFSEHINIFEKFNNLLSITLVEKIFQPCLRLINNIIVLCNDNILKFNLINLFFKKDVIIRTLNNILINYNKEFNDTSIMKDILLLIFNLSCFEPKQTKEKFFSNIIKLTLNNNFYNDVEIIKFLIYIYYRLYVFDNRIFNINEKNIINTFYLYFQFNQKDLGINLMLLDIFNGCLIAMKKNINNYNDIQNIISATNSNSNINMDIIQKNIILEYNEINN